MASVDPREQHAVPAARSCPHPSLVTGDPAYWDATAAFRELQERSSVQQVVLPGGLVAWLITGAAQARKALADPRLAYDMRRLPDPRQGFGGCRYPDDIFSAEGRHLLNSDGADHKRLRSLLAPLLSRTDAERWRPSVRRSCAELLDGLAAAAAPDLVSGYARPLAVRVTAEMLGVPEDMQQRLTGLTLSMISAPGPEDPAVLRRRTELFGLWARIIGEKRRDPGDDLLSRLVLAHGRGRLTAQELISVAWGLYSGGITPTTALIVSGAVEIMRRPELRRPLRDRAGAARLTEELLRVTSPFPTATWRFALDDIAVGDTVIPQGAVVLVALAAANRDPAVFSEPGTVRTDRPGGHLSFGLGPHYCPGAPLARLQATEALTALFGRFPGLRLAVAESSLRRQGVLVDRCYEQCPRPYRPRPRPGCHMRQLPAAEAEIEPGHAWTWRLSFPEAPSAPGPLRPTSYNQAVHLTGALSARQAGRPIGHAIACSFELPGPVDLFALEAALLHLVHRHEVLRTRCRPAGRSVSVRICAPDEAGLERVETGPLTSRAATRAHLHRLIGQLDPVTGPVVVLGAVAREDSATVLVVYDHLVADVLSAPITVADLAGAYEDLVLGRRPDTTPVGGFPDFAREERGNNLSLHATDERLGHWRDFTTRRAEFLPSFPLDLGVPADRWCPPADSSCTLLPERLTQQLEAVCRESGGSLLTGLLAATAVSVRDVGGPDTYRTLLPVNSRGSHRYARSVGWFTNAVPVEIPAPRGADFATLLAGARQGLAAGRSQAGVHYVRAQQLLGRADEPAAHHRPVGFLSYLDLRTVPGAEHPAARTAAVHVRYSACNGSFFWFVRSHSGLHLNHLHPDTSQARRTVSSLLGTLTRTLHAFAAGDRSGASAVDIAVNADRGPGARGPPVPCAPPGQARRGLRGMTVLLYYPGLFPPREVVHRSLLYWDGVASVVPRNERLVRELIPRDLEQLRELGLYFPLAPNWDRSGWRGRQGQEEWLCRELERLPAPAVPLSVQLEEGAVPRHLLHQEKTTYRIVNTLLDLGLAAPVDGAWAPTSGRRWMAAMAVTPEAYDLVLSTAVRGLVAGSENGVWDAVTGGRARHALHPCTDSPEAHRWAHLPSTQDRGLCWEVQLGPLLPVPAPTVELADVLAFRDRHRDERLRMMRAVHRLLGDLRRDYEHPVDVLEQLRAELDEAVRDYLSAARSSRLVWVSRSFTAAVALGAAAAGTLLMPDLGWVLGTVGGFALNVATRETRPILRASRDHDFTYLHRVQAELR